MKFNMECKICLKSLDDHITLFDWLKNDAIICADCTYQLQPFNKVVIWKGMPLYICYVYNDFMERLLFQFKENRDIALAPIFLHQHKRYLEKKYKDYTMVYMPSSLAKSKWRGFCSLEEIFQNIKLKKQHLFYKSSDIKQSESKYEDRRKIIQHIHRNDAMIQTSKVCLIDDVCTSGSTLLAAKELLKKENLKIVAFVLCATKSFIEANTNKKWHII